MVTVCGEIFVTTYIRKNFHRKIFIEDSKIIVMRINLRLQ